MASIRDHAILNSTAYRLEELIEVCLRGGSLHSHAPNLAADVTRKAKALRTALAGLVAALEGEAQPQQPEGTRRKQPLTARLHSQPLLFEMIRFVGHGGRSEIEFWDFYREMASRYTQLRASAAVDELLDIDKATLPATVHIKPAVLPLCRLMLGPEIER